MRCTLLGPVSRTLCCLSLLSNVFDGLLPHCFFVQSGVVGNLATEAKAINLSLHYLEQVIVALSEKSRTHIPYRNSMMTSVLKDSLGGNCKTTMIATLNTMKQNLDESISTCRFAQRVALIKNEALINEEGDPLMVIAALRKEVERLTASPW